MTINQTRLDTTMLKATKKAGNYEPVPQGTHVARLYQIIHIGTSHYEYKGDPKSTDKVRLTFELSNERKEFKEGEGEKPFSVSREFGLTMGTKSHLRPFVESIRGKSFSTDEEAYDFDVESLLGIACLLNVVHEEKDGKVYANIATATPLVKGMAEPELFNKTSFIDVNTSSEDDISALPDFIKEKIYKSDEWAARQRGPLVREEEPALSDLYGSVEIDPNDIPF